MMLDRKRAVLAFIDVQGRLAEIVHERAALFGNLERLVRGALLLNLPILRTEQLPQKIGPTAEPFAALLDGFPPIVKSAFSCWGEPAFRKAVEATGRRQLLLAGIETHVCVCQTALDLLACGFQVFVAADAVSSREADSKRIALDRMQAAGAGIVSTEMVLLELLRDAAAPEFRDLHRLIK